MKRDRQIILSLLALGRITPAEAERLLAAWNAGREELLVLSACLVVGLMEFLPGLANLTRHQARHLAHTLLPEGIPGVHHAITAISFWVGGVL
jgi:hypothetical protein